ncbi:hypothetical protein AWC38_SpisGene22588 [Stylophora pistillata]|uniref:Serine protease n=1 Tax=Stylophora pistillata TaxID=50429 RepID=A0A2B4R4R7_STYPI|nr:hypothetical protein AWC38_SpisGene22588 [Stylophora pistillata]
MTPKAKFYFDLVELIESAMNPTYSDQLETLESCPPLLSLCISNEGETGEDEAWEDSIKKCNLEHGRGQTVDEDEYHKGFLEVSDPSFESRIKEWISSMFQCNDLYRNILKDLLEHEGELLYNIFGFSATRGSRLYIEGFLRRSRQKKQERMEKAKDFLTSAVENVTIDIMRRIDGVVRVQRKRTRSGRDHGTGTGIVVRLNRSGTRHTPDTKVEGDFAILTNNHVIANEEEAAAATIDFFYNAAAGNRTQGPPPSGVVTKRVEKLLTWSPPIPVGTRASSEEMDFSILTFDVGTDHDFIDKLSKVSFYLNEIFENGLPHRPLIKPTKPLFLLAIGHPHGSNKRISFGQGKEPAVEKKGSAEDYETTYDLTTCQGSSGCPVLAILVSSMGYLKAALQFLHFKKGRGINIMKLYPNLNKRREVGGIYKLYYSHLNSHEMIFCNSEFPKTEPSRRPIWWDDEDDKYCSERSLRKGEILLKTIVSKYTY